MGCCDIIPNGSVHWNITHQKENGHHKMRPKRDPSKAGDDAADVITVEETVARGIDPVEHGIGKGKNHKGEPQNHADKLRVTLRFPILNRAEAKQALEEAAKAVDNASEVVDPKNRGTGLFEVRVDIKARPTDESNTSEHPQNPYAQVCVEW
jgi:hypothetical protein